MNLYQDLFHNLTQEIPGILLKENEPLSKHTSFRIGGPAALMAFPCDGEQAVQCWKIAKMHAARTLVIGNGSNLLAPDAGLDAFIICTTHMKRIEINQNGCIVADGGVLLSKLAITAADHGMTGLEFAHGIPGTLAGAVTMNAGAYGGEMANVIVRTEFINADGKIQQINAAEHAFSYRHSFFSQQEVLILSAVLQLQNGDQDEIRNKMTQLAEKRRQSQPLEHPSAGSMFKRPEGHYAAALIEQCGLKGLTVGDAQVSTKHSGFVINQGNATCEDVLSLVEQVKRSVLQKTGVTLAMEVKLLGAE